MTFHQKWQEATQHSRLAIGIAPQMTRMPAPIARYDDPFLPFGDAIISATVNFACAYVFDLASYLVLGAAGIIALERTMPLVPRHLITILHAPFSTPAFAPAAFESPGVVDAVTLETGHITVVSAYTQNPERGVFVHSRSAMTSNQRDNVGFYDDTGFEMDGVRLLWQIDPIIYASGKDDFAEVAAQASDLYRQESLNP